MKIVTKSGTVYDNITEITVGKSPSGVVDRLFFGSTWLHPWEIVSITETTPVLTDELVKSNANLKECLKTAEARIEKLKGDLEEVQRRNTCLSKNLSGVNEKVRALEAENQRLKRLTEELEKAIQIKSSFTQRFEITVKPV